MVKPRRIKVDPKGKGLGGHKRGGARRSQELGSVWVNDEPREGAVLVGVAPMHLPSVQLDEDFVAHVQVQDHAVAGVVVVLVSILSDGAGPDLGERRGC